jgi:hypothetical protein
MKTCKKCGEAKALIDFPTNRTCKDGRTSECRLCTNKRITEWRTTTDKGKRNKRRQTVARHGITLERYEELLAKQGGTCAVCPRTQSANGRVLAVDHDHTCCPGQYSCGKCVRGLLCDGCNRMIGAVNDDVDRLAAGMKYLNDRDWLDYA